MDRRTVIRIFADGEKGIYNGDLGLLYNRFCIDVRSEAKNRTLPLLVSQRTDSQNELSELGFAGLSSWAEDGGFRGTDPGTLVIHWPSIFRWDLTCHLETLVHRGFESLVLLLLRFGEVFARRSPLLWELLRRKVLDVLVVTKQFTPPSSHVPLSVAEEQVLQVLFHELRTGQSPIIPALAFSFDQTFKAYLTYSPDTLFARLRRKYYIDVRGERDNMSVVQVAPFITSDPRVKPPTSVSIGGIDSKKFTASRLPFEVYEMLIAYDLAFNGASPRCGAQSITDDNLPPALVINCAKFFNFRKEMGATKFYEPYCKLPDDLQAGQQISDRLRLYFDKRPELRSPTLERYARAKLFGADRVWPEIDWTTSVVVCLSKMPAFLSHLRSLENAREAKSSDPRPKKKGRAGTAAPLRQRFVGVNGEVFDFLLLRHHRQIVFSPLFFIPEDLIWGETRLIRGKNRRKLLPGVHYRRPLSAYFFTVDALMRSADLPFSKVDGMAAWLLAMSKLPLAQFQRLKQVQEGDNPLALLSVDSRNQPYSLEEDAVIAKHYRASMTNDDWREIELGCPSRSRESVKRRARQLALSMIKEGVYDIENLPILRRSAEILKAIRVARGRDGGGNARR